MCDFLQKSSIARKTRSQRLRGKNISKFQRDFEIGDIVRFNMQDKSIGFGKISGKRGTKIYTVDRIDWPDKMEIHAQQMELVVITEYFLKKMLKII